jgi:CRP-like cAMP-binding protein
VKLKHADTAPVNAEPQSQSPRSHNRRSSARLSLDNLDEFGEDEADELTEAPPKRSSILWNKGHHIVRMNNILEHYERQGAKEIMIENEISNMGIVSSCSRDFVQMLAAGVSSRPCKEGEVIVRESQAGTSLILSLRGTVDVSISGAHVTEMTSGHYLGETNLLRLESIWTVTLVARYRSDICEITRETWEKTLENFPSERSHFQIIKAQHESCMERSLADRTCLALQGLSQTALLALDHRVWRRLFFPGQKMTVQGDRGSELFILNKGRVAVEIDGRCVRSIPRHEPNGLCKDMLSGRDERRRTSEQDTNSLDAECFGELSFFGVRSCRTASVVAQTMCQVAVLHRDTFMQTLQECGETLRLSEMSQLSSSQGRRQSFSSVSPLTGRRQSFSSLSSGISFETAMQEKMSLCASAFLEGHFSDQFLTFLAQNLEEKVFLSRQQVQLQKNSLYILGKGMLAVRRDGLHIKAASKGAVFGGIPALRMGSVEQSITYEADTVCFVEVLHQSIIIQGLELFPGDRRQAFINEMTSSHNDDDADATSPHTGSVPIQRESDTRIEPWDTGGGNTGKPARQKPFNLSTVSSQYEEAMHQKDWKSKMHQAFMQAMRTSALFANLSLAFLEHLNSISTDRIYMPGDFITEEGKWGDSLFIMISGSAGVFADDIGGMGNTAYWMSYDPNSPTAQPDGSQNMMRIGSLSPGSIAGELAMLGVTKFRSATIQAEMLCLMCEIRQERVLSTLHAFPDAQRAFNNTVLARLSKTAASCVLQLPIFKGFDQKFRMLVGLYCEKRAYFPGHPIVREGHNCDGMYVVNTGSARLEYRSVTIKTLMPGMVFGATVMLGVNKKAIGTLIALETCHILVITQKSFALALEEYPCRQLCQELIAREIESHNEFSDAIQRIVAQKSVWRRYQRLSLDRTGHAQSEDTQKSDRVLLRQAMQVWKRYFSAHNEKRARTATQKQKVEEWVQRQRDGREKRRIKDEVQHMAQPRNDRGNELVVPIGSGTSDGGRSRSQSPREVLDDVQPPNYPRSNPASPRLTPRPPPVGFPGVTRSSRPDRSPVLSTKLPSLRMRNGWEVYLDGSDADNECSPRRLPLAGLSPRSGLAPKHSARGLPLYMDGTGDGRGNHRKVIRLAGSAGHAESRTQIFWQGFGV